MSPYTATLQFDVPHFQTGHMLLTVYVMQLQYVT